jgi:hypothetical protein
MVRGILLSVLLGSVDGYLIASGVFHVTNSVFLELALGLPLVALTSWFIGRGVASYVMPSPRRTAALPLPTATRINAALAIAREVYGGTGEPRPTEDVDQLLDIANWMDRVDNVTDAAKSALGLEAPVDRQMQEELRRIAGVIKAQGCNGSGGCCAT